MRYLEPEELLAVLEAARKYGTREWCMFLLAYRHGLRASEITHLTLVDVADGRIDCRRLKGSLRTIHKLERHHNPLLDETKALAAWLADRGEADGSQMLFTSREGGGMHRSQAFRLFQKIATRAGISKDRRFFHVLKHSICTHLVQLDNANIAYVRQAIGHKDPKSTIQYTHVTDKQASSMVNSALERIF
jgi:type 1 fimbriae regulatory protein FimE